jgi:hypothetical protein
LFLGGCLKALPRERSTTKVHHDISQGFKIITTRLFNAEMGVDGGVSRCPCEVFVLTIGNVKMGFGVAVFLGETKVDDIDLISTFADSHEEVVGFDITVDERFGVDIFNSRDLLSVK